MISLLLAATIVVLIDPPQPLDCSQPGVRVVLASGEEIHAVRASYLPTTRGIVVVPVAPGRVFCDGFERRAL